MGQTPAHRLIELKLDRSLASYVEERKAAGLGFRPIAKELAKLTGVPVSYESLRTWLAEDKDAAA